MQLRHLHTLVAIAEHGTLTSAARHLRKTQGAVSNDLKALESELAVQLVDRTGQRAKLTTAGEFLLPYARELTQRVDEISSHMRSFKAGEVRPVRLGVLPSLCAPLLDVMVRYRALAPDTRFRVQTSLEDPIIASLDTGDIDIGIGQPSLQSEIESLVVASEVVVAVVRRDDPLAQKEFVTPHELVDGSLVGFTRHLGGPGQILNFFGAIGRYPEPVVEVDDYRLMGSLIARGTGYGLMPERSVATDEGLVPIPTQPEIKRQIALLTRRDRALAARERAFYEYLTGHWPVSPA